MNDVSLRTSGPAAPVATTPLGADTARRLRSSAGGSLANLAEYDVDPYEIAYLRGGTRELLKLRLFELVQRGYLIVIEKRRWYGTKRCLAVAPDLQNWNEMTPPDQQLLTFFRTPRTSKEIFDPAFPQELEGACWQYRQELGQSGMLTGRLAPEDGIYEFFRIALGGGIFLLWFIMTFVMYSVLLFAAAFGALFIFSLILHFCFEYRPTQKGKRYLKELGGRFESLAKPDNATWANTSHTTQLIAVAVFGLGILAGTPFDALAEILGRQAARGGVEYGVEVDGGGGGCGGCGGCGG